MVTLLARSKIILGHGGIGWSASLKNIKGRDFDGPCAGSGAYLTSYHPELADFFRIGEEIVCYSSPDECIELARWLLADDPRRRAIARAGRERCLREHTWLHRFKRILQTLGVLASSTRC
jgi:spore maturation protein CgeB